MQLPPGNKGKKLKQYFSKITIIRSRLFKIISLNYSLFHFKGRIWDIFITESKKNK